MQPMQFKQYMDIQKERNKTDDKLNPVYENIYQNLHDEDNPILIIYELPYKNNIIEEYTIKGFANGIDTFEALVRLTSGNPFTLKEVLGEA